ncbi:uncharacterized protein LOC114303669, partial [Camellia sinensis]|uniref:uncharacterized protein LOC114303669 n=1 Tax=Camellia sinensis TaxID=4442 RepID=UPI001036DB12
MGLVKGVVVGSNGTKITHLQFADDTILLCEADWEAVVTIKRILRCFEILSGLKINYHKSVVSGVGINEESLKDFAAKLNCLHKKLPLKYLGLPLGANPRRRRTWQPVLDKCKQRLASWKRRFLSFADNALWKQVICCKYPKVGRGWWSLPVENYKLSMIWRDIMGVAGLCSQLVNFFKQNIVLDIGDGSRTMFWTDTWIGNICLKDEFPRLFFVSLDKSESVAGVRNKGISFQEWKLNFRRALFQWEMKELGRLNLLLLNAPVLRFGRMDSIRWKANKFGFYTVDSAYSWNVLPSKVISTVTGFILKNVAPLRVQFFGWLSWKGRIKTSCFLQRLGVLSRGSNVNCIFCNNDWESVNHVLLFCPFTWRIWIALWFRSSSPSFNFFVNDIVYNLQQVRVGSATAKLLSVHAVAVLDFVTEAVEILELESAALGAVDVVLVWYDNCY